MITQFVPGCSGAFVQFSVSLKSPLAVIPVKVTAVVPLFVAVIANGFVLVVPTCCCPNERFEADKVSVDD